MNPLILSLLSSLATIIGSFFINIKYNKDIIYYSFAFAGGVMITVSLIDLIPESFIKLNIYFNFLPSIIILLIFFSIGVIVSFIIDKFVPNNDEIYRVGIISLIAIVIHNIPEGIATYIAGSIDIKLGITLSVSIALHNIPEGIAIAIPIYYISKNKFKAIFYTTIAGLSEFIGSLIALIFFKNLITDLFIGTILSIIAGIMFQISIYELIPNSFKCKNKGRVVVYFILGIFIMGISIILI